MTAAHEPNENDGPHEGPIKTPKQLILAVFWAFVVPIFGIILLVMYVTTETRPSAGSDARAPKSIAERIRPVGMVEVKDASDAPSMKTGEQVYAAQCTACHATGALNAPKLGDAAAWGPRIKARFDALLHSALAGKGQMPPQGGGDFSDFEIGRAVVYMANQGGAKFPEPAVPAAGASGPTTARPARRAGDRRRCRSRDACRAAAPAPATAAAPAARTTSPLQARRPSSTPRPARLPCPGRGRRAQGRRQGRRGRRASPKASTGCSRARSRARARCRPAAARARATPSSRPSSPGWSASRSKAARRSGRAGLAPAFFLSARLGPAGRRAPASTSRPDRNPGGGRAARSALAVAINHQERCMNPFLATIVAIASLSPARWAR
jgi:cytochrome c5